MEIGDGDGVTRRKMTHDEGIWREDGFNIMAGSQISGGKIISWREEAFLARKLILWRETVARILYPPAQNQKEKR